MNNSVNYLAYGSWFIMIIFFASYNVFGSSWGHVINALMVFLQNGKQSFFLMLHILVKDSSYVLKHDQTTDFIGYR